MQKIFTQKILTLSLGVLIWVPSWMENLFIKFALYLDSIRINLQKQLILREIRSIKSRLEEEKQHLDYLNTYLSNTQDSTLKH